ncbi:MAG TPA: IPTL-CTERM sorting domain-containing protein [Thermoanaerobaculia bacterium]|nr:IPTL-CTERM sorting domain-containing protein [Thermoanaerobaculia bacterium]
MCAALTAGYPALAQTAPRFGDAASFVVLGNGSVTNSGATQITGNVGVSPGNTVNGLSSANFLLGEVRRDDALARAGRSDGNRIDDELAGTPCHITLTDSELGGKTLTRGAYCFPTADVALSGTLILDAEGDREAVWIFRIAGTLTTASDASVLVVENGYDGNVFWRTGGAATIGARTSFIGNLFATGNIVFQDRASLSGRAISRSGSVSLTANRLSLCCAPITVMPASVPNGTLGTDYRQTFTADGGGAPYTFAITSGSLPFGLTLDPTGALHGTPMQTGTFAFTVTATDVAGCAGSAAYRIEIACGTRTVLPAATIGASYGPVSLFDGTACSVTSGAVPPGMFAGCALTGTPTTEGTFEFVVESGRRSRCFTIEVGDCPIDFPSEPDDGTACMPYSDTIGVTGGVAPYVFTSPPLPCGLTLSATGTLSGTPPAKATCIVPVTVTDALSRSCSRTFTIEIGCPPSEGSPVVLPNATVCVLYDEPLPPRTCGEGVTYSGDAPLGLGVEGTRISGVPTTSGTFTFPVESRTSDGCVITHDVTITIDCPEVTLSPLPPMVKGVPYDETIVVTDGDCEYSLTDDSLPEGIDIDGLRIHGTPFEPGPYEFTITAVNAMSGCSGSRHYTPNCGPLHITPTTVPNGRVGVAYPDIEFTVAGGTAPYVFTITTGSLPPGLTLTGDTLSDTPTTVGTYAFGLRVTDRYGCSGTVEFCAIDIAPGTCPDAVSLGLAPAELPPVTPSAPYAVAITPSGGTSPYTLTISDGTLPTGLVLIPTGIVGVTTQTGVFPLTITTTDSSGCRVSLCYTLFVGTAIPTLSQWALLLVAAILSIAGCVAIGRR